jgi:probable phosphoglycerate mutase
MARLYLIRHAENDWIGKRLPGWARGLHLNERGRRQAERLAEVLADVRFAALYTSPLERAVETAAPLARAQKLKPEVRPGLGDLKVGRWQGQPLAALRLRKLWRLVQNAPSQARFPGGESFTEAQARLVAEVDNILTRHPSPKAAIAVVSHADPIKLIVAHYIGLPLDLFQRLGTNPVSITILAIGGGFTRLERLNDGRAGQVPPIG